MPDIPWDLLDKGVAGALVVMTIVFLVFYYKMTNAIDIRHTDSVENMMERYEGVAEKSTDALVESARAIERLTNFQQRR